MDTARYCFIISAAPGAGKSTLANKLINASKGLINEMWTDSICEADDFFMKLGKGKYAFNPKLLWKAHKECQDKAAELANAGNNFIVSNTNVKARDRKFYFDLAKDNGYKVIYIHLTTNFGSIHNVPDEAIQRMIDSYEDLTPYEKSLVVKTDDMTDELASVLAKAGVKYDY